MRINFATCPFFSSFSKTPIETNTKDNYDIQQIPHYAHCTLSLTVITQVHVIGGPFIANLLFAVESV